MAVGPSPVYRSQGNIPFRSERQDAQLKRGQTVPYDVNGSPTAPPDEPGALVLNIANLPAATPSVPLFEFEVPAGGIVFTGVGDELSAGVAATAPSALRYFKNGVANGTLTFTGTAGVSAFSDSTYAAGDLFGLYPPTSIDATLDRLRITLGTD
jgi:hypothetical protein